MGSLQQEVSWSFTPKYKIVHFFGEVQSSTSLDLLGLGCVDEAKRRHPIVRLLPEVLCECK